MFWGVRGQEFWGIASPSDAYHLPQILAQELPPLGRSGDDFGEVFLRVLGFLRSSSTDRLRMLGGQSVAGRQSARGSRSFCGLFRQNLCFWLVATFVLRTVRALSSGQSAPSLADSPRQPGGQSDLYADSCQV
jgi:hypothetical protein